MGLFDIVKEKVSELLSGAGDKVTELTGTELPGTDQLAQSAEGLTETATTAAGDLTGTAQGLSDTATGTVQDLSGSASDAVSGTVTDATDRFK